MSRSASEISSAPGTRVLTSLQHAQEPNRLEGLHLQLAQIGVTLDGVDDFQPAPRKGLPREAAQQVQRKVVEQVCQAHERCAGGPQVRHRVRLAAEQIREQGAFILREAAEKVRQGEQHGGM